MLSIISIPAALFLVVCVSETDVFGATGVMKNLWMFWLFMPIPIGCIVCGILLHVQGKKRVGFYVVASIALFLLFMYGLFTPVFTITGDVSYNPEIVTEIERRVGVELPNDIKVGATRTGNYKEIYAKILDEHKKSAFIKLMSDGDPWIDKLPTSISSVLPAVVGIEVSNSEYFLFYNETNGKYNIAPTQNGEYDCIIIAYDVDVGRLYIAYDFTVKIDN